ncbi:MAG: hypothetical protein ACTHN5_07100 [Phycisphaerae bacterium]
MTDAAPQTLPPESVSDDEFLLAFLDCHEAPCPACGYNCHKVREPRCPECGIALVLRIAAPFPVRKSWVALLVASAATAGIGTLLLAWVLRHHWAMPHARSGFGKWLFLYFMILVPSPVAVLWGRRRFSFLPRPVRAGIGLGALLWTALAIIRLLALS